MESLFQGFSQETLWFLVVFYDLLLIVLLFKLFGKYGLYCGVILGIILGNLQGGKVSEFILFGNTFTVSMGAILYSGIYFSTDLLNEKYGKNEANRAVNIGFFANIAVLVTLLLSLLFKPSDLTGSASEVHNALAVLASYSPAFIIGSLTAYYISQTFDVWFFKTVLVMENICLGTYSDGCLASDVYQEAIRIFFYASSRILPIIPS